MFSAKKSAGPSGDRLYVEDVFSTYLYTGNGSTQTINNGIDLSGEGGLVWLKTRTDASGGAHFNISDIFDTSRGALNRLRTYNTNAAGNDANSLTSFNSNGVSIGSSSPVNFSGSRFVSWTFRKAPKFFDVVTYTGNGANRTISHSLGSVPGCIIVKRTDTTDAWQVYHRSLANTEYMVLNTTAAKATGATRWNSTTPTSTVFSLGTDATVNDNGGTYVAYLFAHDAGGFGESGTDNVISCGSYTTDGSGNATVTLGWEPQFLIEKYTNTTGSWVMLDAARGWAVGTTGRYVLFANLSDSEGEGYSTVLNSTGFTVSGAGASNSRIYIAIRRGPMKTPTSGTEVFAPVARTGTGAASVLVTGLPVTDAVIVRNRGSSADFRLANRLRGFATLITNSDVEENTTNSALFTTNPWDNQDGFDLGNGGLNNSGVNYINWMFRRSPSVFDVVCYTGTGVLRTVAHNLTVAPELIIVKSRGAVRGWMVGTEFTSNTYSLSQLQSTDAGSTNSYNAFYAAAPTASSFTVGTDSRLNFNGDNYVAHLFATLTGVSKVGSYTGNGSNQTIDCGFTAGARFVLIKRTDAVGDWYVWDSARGINPSGTNDPYLRLNLTAAEVTTNDSLSAQSSGFGVIQNATTNINVNGASYIYLSVA
jgi:hypothetical protein